MLAKLIGGVTKDGVKYHLAPNKKSVLAFFKVAVV